MEELRRYVYSFVAVAGVLCLCLGASGEPALAAEPVAEIQEDSTATLGGLAVYTVAAEDQVPFLEALVESGGYVGFQPGFANERIVRSFANDDPTEVTYLVLTRHYSRYGMYQTLAKRDAAVLPYLAGASTYVPMNLEEHQVPNWGWERGSAVAFTRFGPEGNPTVLNQYGTSLSFFKYGYTGQTAVVRTFPATDSLTDVRQAIFADSGLAGASIFRSPSDGSYLVYAEYFETPLSYASERLRVASAGDALLGAEAGVVVENYKAR